MPDDTLPTVTVVEGQAQKPQLAKHAKGLAPVTKSVAPAPPTNAPAPMFEWSTTDAGTEPGANAQQQALDRQMQGMDQSRENLLTKIGASSYSFSREAIQTLPQGDNTEIDKIVLQAPGVNYDSAASNPDYHIRGEYANVQYRINGIALPEGVSGLGPVIDAGFIGRLSLLTGTLPAEYGLRTAGVLDITSRAFSVPGGTVTMYGGSRETTTPSFDYGGSFGNTQYFVAARGNWNALGIENPTPSINAIHDFTDQGKFFGYVSTLLNESDAIELNLWSLLQRIPDTQQSRPDTVGRLRPCHLQLREPQRKRVRHVRLQHGRTTDEGRDGRHAARSLHALR